MNCLNCGGEMTAETTCGCSPTYCANCCQCGPNCELCHCSAVKAKAGGGGVEEETDEEPGSED